MARPPGRPRMKFFNRSLPKSRGSGIVPPFGQGARSTRQQYVRSIAAVAQLVERNLAKVEVESSRLFCRSSFRSSGLQPGQDTAGHRSCSSVSELSLGKGEVGSSILPMSTTRLAERPVPKGTGLFCFVRGYQPWRNASAAGGTVGATSVARGLRSTDGAWYYVRVGD